LASAHEGAFCGKQTVRCFYTLLSKGLSPTTVAMLLMWRHAVCLRKSFMATMHASTGLWPRFTSVMGAIWDC